VSVDVIDIHHQVLGIAAGAERTGHVHAEPSGGATLLAAHRDQPVNAGELAVYDAAVIPLDSV
jgi:hypothetical protein